MMSRVKESNIRLMSSGKDPVSTTSSTEAEEVADVVLKEIPDAQIHWEYGQDSSTARVYDRKPMKLLCKEGKMYMWLVLN